MSEPTLGDTLTPEEVREFTATSVAIGNVLEGKNYDVVCAIIANLLAFTITDASKNEKDMLRRYKFFLKALNSLMAQTWAMKGELTELHNKYDE
jgi:hypothetical protein